MSILGNPITLGGGGADLNIDFGSTPPADTSMLNALNIMGVN